MINESYINLKGLAIRLLTAGNKGRSIVFVHGNSCTADFWSDQLEDPTLQEKYNLIAFDLPGHGKSARGGSYRLKDLAELIPDLTSQLELKEYILTGLSFGTCLIGEAAPFVKNCKGFFLASPNITNDEQPPTSFLTPVPEGYALAAPSVPDEILSRFAGLFIADQSSALIDQYKNSYLHTDGTFRTAVGTAIMESDWSDELANLRDTHLPICLAFGEKEKMLDTHYLDGYTPKWRDEIFKIPQAAHMVNAESPAAFNTLLSQFAEDVFR